MHKADILVCRVYPVLDARCPECGKKAQMDDDATTVKCEYCGFQSTYDEYLEIMKGKVENMADDYLLNWDRKPF
ncbi:MAG: zinc-domain-containing protein [Nitrososphaera sp.]|jgi:endogenous inhibitor of DNA gyrase (YacG/DUF329 family)|nr:zinc-domain-containing protein [Nitrososphaera sp.]